MAYFRTFDRFGNRYKAADLAFALAAKCRQSPARSIGGVTAVEAEPGLYEASFIPTAAGLWDLEVTHISAWVAAGMSAAGGHPRRALRASVEVQSGPTLPLTSTAQGAALWTSTIGLPANFSVRLKANAALIVSSCMVLPHQTTACGHLYQTSCSLSPIAGLALMP